MTPDPLLAALSFGAAAQTEIPGGVIHVVADGVVWQGRLIGPAMWASSAADTPAQGDNLRDAVTSTWSFDLSNPDTLEAAQKYLHFEAASYLASGKWTRVHGVRVAIASVSAWWMSHTDD